MNIVLFALAAPPLDLPVWSVAPFALLLLCVAVLPLIAEHWWHKNRQKAIISAALGLPVAVYLLILHFTHGQPTLPLLEEKLLEYGSFIALLGSLYVISGGIVVRGDLPARPTTNVLILAIGIVLANFVGTTGASMLLIRPLLRINHHRLRRGHLPIFFIFCVSNTGGLLTPLGDPPLFLGFLNGVPFAWTLTIWREWLFVNGLILAIFFVWDRRALRGEPAHAPGDEPRQTLRIIGSVNFLFLGGVLADVLLQGMLSDPWREIVPPLLMVALAGLSLKFTPPGLREANAFTWEPIVEVAVLFIGIFITMVPALAILKARGGELGIIEPWQFFWLTGGLSAFLDNAPTYLTFANLASGEHDLGWLAAHNDPVLRAISLGAVLMGALTYIGNGPNFMVKAIADQSGVKMPSFFGYLGFACVVLLPIFALVDVLFLH